MDVVLGTIQSNGAGSCETMICATSHSAAGLAWSVVMGMGSEWGTRVEMRYDWLGVSTPHLLLMHGVDVERKCEEGRWSN